MKAAYTSYSVDPSSLRHRLALIHSLKNIAALHYLQYLYMAGTRVSDASLRQVVSLFPSLKWLSLEGVDHCSDEGFRCLGELEQLELLEMSSSEFCARFTYSFLLDCLYMCSAVAWTCRCDA